MHRETCVAPLAGRGPGPRDCIRRARARFWGVILIVLLLLYATPTGASATATHRCWTAIGDDEPVLRCRVGGVELIDFVQPGSVGVPLHAGVGEDVWGECWFHTEESTGWTAVGDWTSDSAELSYSIAGSAGLDVVAGSVRRCTTDPAVTFSEVIAVRLMRSHEYQRVRAVPSPRRGVVALDVYLAVSAPQPGRYVAGDLAGNEAVLVEIDIASVAVDWGDGSAPLVVSAEGMAGMTGYPTGSVVHRYRTPGNYGIRLATEWTARWRSSWDPRWRPVLVGVFTEIVAYPVDQIVGRVVR